MTLIDACSVSVAATPLGSGVPGGASWAKVPFGPMKPALERAVREGKGWYLPPSHASFYGVSEPADAAWLKGKLTV